MKCMKSSNKLNNKSSLIYIDSRGYVENQNFNFDNLCDL